MHVYWNRLTLGEFFRLRECVERVRDYAYYVDLVRGCTPQGRMQEFGEGGGGPT